MRAGPRKLRNRTYLPILCAVFASFAVSFEGMSAGNNLISQPFLASFFASSREVGVMARPPSPVLHVSRGIRSPTGFMAEMTSSRGTSYR